MKPYVFLLTGMMMAQVALGQIGAKKETILAYERTKGSEWKGLEGDKIYALNKNVNTYYYFKNGRCTNIVKIVGRSEIGALKQYLEENGYKYDTMSSSYKKENLIGAFDYQNQLVYLKIGQLDELVLNK